MKNLLVSVFGMMLFFNCSIDASDYAYDQSIISRLGVSNSVLGDQTMENLETREKLFNLDARFIAGKADNKSYSTNAIAYQYTNDGWLQHVGVYSDCVICTNVAGPREGLQLIIAHNGAMIDMCHNYKMYKDHFTNKYTWGEVITYETYQVVKIK